jgi:hypothetical protein
MFFGKYVKRVIRVIRRLRNEDRLAIGSLLQTLKLRGLKPLQMRQIRVLPSTQL